MNTIKLLSIALAMMLALSASAQHVQYRSTKHYNEKVAKFEAAYHEIDSTKIVMLGNSLTEGGGNWNKLIETSDSIVNRGISGDCARGIMERLSQILPKHPKAIFLMCGINDLSHNLSAENVAQLCIDVVEKIREESPQTKLHVLGLLPFDEDSRWTSLKGKSADVPVINALLSDYCSEHDIPFINFYNKLTLGDTNVLSKPFSRDGLHVNNLGYMVWAAELTPYIKALEQQEKN